MLDDDFTMVSPTARVRYSLDLARLTSNEALERLRSFVQTGVGFTYIELDLPGVGFRF